MLAENRKKTNIGVGVGISLEILGKILIGANSNLAIPGLILVLIGVVFFIWGCMNYAEGKGYNKLLGLLGLLSCLGLIILIILPDQHKS
jgi:hypothetical protein